MGTAGGISAGSQDWEHISVGLGPATGGKGELAGQQAWGGGASGPELGREQGLGGMVGIGGGSRVAWPQGRCEVRVALGQLREGVPGWTVGGSWGLKGERPERRRWPGAAC